VLTLHVDEVTTQLVTGEEFRIDPGRRHWAESDSDAPAWVHVACSPPFSPTDYFLDE
jgi:quercetin dioxygenase-like cupin family protein